MRIHFFMVSFGISNKVSNMIETFNKKPRASMLVVTTLKINSNADVLYIFCIILDDPILTPFRRSTLVAIASSRCAAAVWHGISNLILNPIISRPILLSQMR